jgi:hypothetical protein
MKDNVISFYETHVLCQSGDEEAPPTLALHIAVPVKNSFGVQGNAIDFKDCLSI